MKITINPVGIGPDYYTIDGDVITAHIGDVVETYDLSGMPELAIMDAPEPIGGAIPIEFAQRINGELHVTLLQRVGAGNWAPSDAIDSADYSGEKVYVKLVSIGAGKPIVFTRAGELEVKNG